MKQPIKITSAREEANVLHLLSVLLMAGVPLVKAVGPAKKAFPKFTFPFDIVAGRLEKGEFELFEGLGDYFSPVVPVILKYGSLGGMLEVAFLRASDVVISTEKLAALGGGVSPEKINELNYYRLLGHMLGCGSPLLSAMNIAAELYLPAEIRESVRKPIMEGEMISDGFRANPKFFSPIGAGFVNMGEQIGAVPEACETFAEFQERYLALSAVKTDFECLLTAELFIEFAYLKFLLNFSDTITLERCLTLVSEASTVPSRKVAFAALAEKVESEVSIGAAMASMPADFPEWMTVMFQEVSNRNELTETLARAMSYISWQLGE